MTIAGKPLTTWLFVLLVVAFVIAFILDILPFPILAVLLLVSWCVLAIGLSGLAAGPGQAALNTGQADTKKDSLGCPFSI